MSLDRERLSAAGWRQGVILEPVGLGDKKALGYLVLSQTCDCINPSLENEPYLELLPLRALEGKPDGQMANGYNPRRIQFEIAQTHEKIWVAANIADIQTFGREKQNELRISDEYSVTDPVLRDLILWRANRYLRAAFPDAFEVAFRGIKNKFGKLVKKNEAILDSILINLDPFDKIESSDRYELQLLLMVLPNVLGVPEQVKDLTKLAEEIQKLFEGLDQIFDEPKCQVRSLDEMTLLERRDYLDFTRYDYLSFGGEG